MFGDKPIEDPEQYDLITEDHGVWKRTLKEGTGERPPLHSRCLVHYVGRIVGTDEVFIDTKRESTTGQPVTLVAGRDSTLKETGIHLALTTMRVGEEAVVWTKPEYAFGEQGNFSFPTIPPNATLVYEIHLIGFEPPTEGKSPKDMTYEERLEAATRRRLEGNVAFKQGDYTEAMNKYSIALAFIDEDLMLQLYGKHYDMAVAEKVPSLLNLAACHLKLKDYHAAVSATTAVLGEQPKNAKALYRRGTARHALGQTDEALKDLAKALEAAPLDKGILREVAAVRRSIKDENKASSNIFKGLVDREKDKGLFEEEDEGLRAPGGVDDELDWVGWETEKKREEDHGWFMSFLCRICPFIFGRRKEHGA